LGKLTLIIIQAYCGMEC